jgi:hypothetical protein
MLALAAPGSLTQHFSGLFFRCHLEATKQCHQQRAMGKLHLTCALCVDSNTSLIESTIVSMQSRRCFKLKIHFPNASKVSLSRSTGYEPKFHFCACSRIERESSVVSLTCCVGSSSVSAMPMIDSTFGQGGGLAARPDVTGGDEWIGSIAAVEIGSSISKDGHWEDGKSVQWCFNEMR